MNIHAVKFGISCGLAAAILWVFCSALVALLPGAMLSMSGNMMHMQLGSLGWHLTIAGVVSGLVAWTVVSGIAGWVVISIYNRIT